MPNDDLANAHIDKEAFLRGFARLGTSLKNDLALLGAITGQEAIVGAESLAPLGGVRPSTRASLAAPDLRALIREDAAFHFAQDGSNYLAMIVLPLRSGIVCITEPELSAALGVPGLFARRHPQSHSMPRGPRPELDGASYRLPSGVAVHAYFAEQPCVRRLQLLSPSLVKTRI